MKTWSNIISVFVTSVNTKGQSEKIQEEVRLIDCVQSCSFDLEDCDKILRVVSHTDVAPEIIRLLNENGFACIELLD